MSTFDLAPRISGALEAREAEERIRVTRALLSHPVLRAQTDGELFRLARRHADHLRAWFDREAGWRLVVDSQTVRLLVSYIPTGPSAVGIAERHPARARRSDPPFTRRRYVLLCLALAVLERSDAQVALGRLSEDIVLISRGPEFADLDFTLATRQERSDLVAAIRLLLRLGVLVRVAGDEEAYVSTEGDALYDVDRRVLATMLSTPHSPGLLFGELGRSASIDEIETALHRPPPAYTEEEINLHLRHAVSRRLLCDPVVYYDELPEDEREYLTRQRVQLTRRLAEATGLVVEMRAEGIALVDPDDSLTDLRMPEQGTDGHVTLLLAERLASGGPVSVLDMRGHVRRLSTEHAAYWRRSAREPGADKLLVDVALERLIALGLVRVTGEPGHETIHPLPALRRFAVTAPRITTPGITTPNTGARP